MIRIVVVNILGSILIFTSVFDALKYSIQANKINQLKSSKGFSRRFINWALTNDLIKLAYGMVNLDLYITLSSILSLVCMFHLFWAIYWWYPYKMRGLLNFKRPSLLTYIINSWQSNKTRRHLWVGKGKQYFIKLKNKFIRY